MKFVCDKCHTKYSIADERVHGRVLKIRCKSCSNVITVREEPRGATATPAPVASPVVKPRPGVSNHTQPIDRLDKQIVESFGVAGGGGGGGMFGDDAEHTMISQGPPSSEGGGGTNNDEWYVSFDGEQEGPMSLDAAIARVRTERPKGREAHCWNPGLFVWKPVEEVPELAPALASRPVAAPPSLPMGARGAGRSSSPGASSGSSATHAVGTSSSSSSSGLGASAGPSASAAGGARLRSEGRSGLAVGAVAAAEALSPPDPMAQMPPQVTKPETRSALRGPGPSTRTPDGPYARANDDRAAALPSSQAAALPDKPRAAAPPIPAAAKSSTGPAKALDPKSSTGPAKALDPKSSTGPAKALDPKPASPSMASPSMASSTKASGKAPAIPESQRDGALTAPSTMPPPPVEAAPVPAPRVDTGPTPLPPPPGGQAVNDDLNISEPSGLFNLSHIAGDLARPVTPVPAAKTAPLPPPPAQSSPSPSPSPAARSSGSPARGSAAAPAGGFADEVVAAAGPVVPNAAPVVVVAGPAVTKTPGWVKLAAIGGLLVSLGLGGALIFVLLKKDPAPVAVTPQETQPATRRADDTPIAVADPGPAATVATTPAKDPVKAPTTGGAKKVGAPKVAAPAPASNGKGLTDSQRNLAALYSDDDKSSSPRELPAVDRSSRPSGGQVSQNAILGVVTQNRRSLNLCYDRVLKRDSSLKRARLVTHVKVGISGSVVGVSIADPEYAKSEIGTCITQAVKHWHFPANDSEYETEFPIILQAD